MKVVLVDPQGFEPLEQRADVLEPPEVLEIRRVPVVERPRQVPWGGAVSTAQLAQSRQLLQPGGHPGELPCGEREHPGAGEELLRVPRQVRRHGGDGILRHHGKARAPSSSSGAPINSESVSSSACRFIGPRKTRCTQRAARPRRGHYRALGWEPLGPRERSRGRSKRRNACRAHPNRPGRPVDHGDPSC